MVFIYRSDCIYFVLRQKQWKVETVFNNRSNRKIVYVTDFSNIIRKNISVTNLRNLIKNWKAFYNNRCHNKGLWDIYHDKCHVTGINFHLFLIVADRNISEHVHCPDKLRNLSYCRISDESNQHPIWKHDRYQTRSVIHFVYLLRRYSVFLWHAGVNIIHINLRVWKALINLDLFLLWLNI